MINYKRLRLARIAGRTVRAHTIPLIHRQTVGEHTYGVLHVLYAINAPLLDLMLAALFHDATEGVLGDVPANVKWKYPQIEKALKEAESTVYSEYAMPRLEANSYEQRLLKYADGMDLALFGIEEMKMGNTHVEKMVGNVLRSIAERDLGDITPEARELYDLAMYEYNKWKRNPE